MPSFATNPVKPVIPDPDTVTTTKWSTAFPKLSEATVTEQSGVSKRRLNKLRVYNADTVQSIVSVRKNAGTIKRPKNTIQLQKTEVEPGETLVVEDVELGKDEQLDIQLSVTPTTSPLERSSQGESF